MTTTGTVEVSTLRGGHAVIGQDDLDRLMASFKGRLLRNGDDGWNEAIEIWNAMVAKTPSLVLQAASAQDVAVGMRFAHEHDLLVSIKGGGHNIAGTAVADGALLLDMSLMNEVIVDPTMKLVNAGPGCRLKDVDGATQELGLATVLGFVSETGVAGLTLGGGFGYLTRRFGWACDNLEEVEIVTADARILTANRKVNSDLFWAVRGGGGNFGVVTRFTFRLHEVGPMITGGLIGWDGERATEVLEAYREITEAAPRELTCAAVILTAPPAPYIPEEWHGRKLVGMLVCYSGRDPDSDLAPLRAIENPVVDLLGEKPYTAQQSMLNDMEPNGLHQYWKTEYLAGLQDQYLDAFAHAALAATSPLSYSVIFHIGGALNEKQEDDGAVGNRDARYISGFSGVWPPNDPNEEEHITWVRAGWEAIRQFSTGGNYVNFQLSEDDVSRTTAAYGKNYERLRQVKAKYDPENRFRVNRNIIPAI